MADIYPESRVEEILVATIDGTEYTEYPQSRIEQLLIELKEVIEAGGGGGGGTTNYNLLENKPLINNVTLTGNKTLSELGITQEIKKVMDMLAGSFDPTADYEEGQIVIYNKTLYIFTTDHTAGEFNPLEVEQTDVDSLLSSVYELIPANLSDLTEDETHRTVSDTEKAAWNDKQDTLTFDDAPTASSNNPVKSGGIYDAIDGVTDVKETAESSPYLYRNSGGAVRNVALEKLKKVIGASIAWNQLVQNGNFADTSNWSKGSNTTWSVSNGVLTATRTDQSSAGNLFATTNSYMNFVGGHKYLMTFKASTNDGKITAIQFIADNQVFAQLNNVGCGTSSLSRASAIVSISQSYSTARISFVFDNRTEMSLSNVMLIDLTQAFGTAIADYIYSLEQATSGSGIAKLKEWGFFTKDYYAYNTGALQSVKTSGKKCVGKNKVAMNLSPAQAQVLNNVTINSQTEQRVSITSSATDYACLRLFYTLPANTYTMSLKANSSDSFTAGAAIYNANGGALIASGIDQSNPKSFTLSSETTIDIRLFATKADAVVRTVEFYDVQLEVGSVATAYEPYTEKTYSLSDVELRGLFKLDGNNKLYADGDEYTPDGNVKRKYGIVDLGSLDWTYSAPDSGHPLGFFYSTSLSGRKAGQSNLICSPYTTGDGTWDTSGVVFGNLNNYTLYVVDSKYTDAATFTTAMSGVYLIYELATPTIETAEAYSDTILVDADGTEEFIDERTVPVPVGHESEYSSIPDWMDNDYFKALEDATYKADILRVNKVDNSIVGTVENGTTASKAYAVGEHFIRNDKFCTAIASIASGAAFTLNTNYVEGTIAENLIGTNSYSSTETVVGKWDGATLYRKTVSLGTLPNATVKSFNIGITTETIRKIEVYYSNNSGYGPLPNNDVGVEFNKSTKKLDVSSSSDYSSYSGTAILEYTK